MLISELLDILETKYHLKHLPEFRWENKNCDVNADVNILDTNGFGRTHLYYTFKPIDSDTRVLYRIAV